MSQPTVQKPKKEPMQVYLKKEFRKIKSDPPYAAQIQLGNLNVFEEPDRLFHIPKPLLQRPTPSNSERKLEWRILTYNCLRLDDDEFEASKPLKFYLDQEFLAIQADPKYKPHIDAGNLEVFDDERLFHIVRPLERWLEWRILSYNELTRAYDDDDDEIKAGSSA